MSSLLYAPNLPHEDSFVKLDDDTLCSGANDLLNALQNSVCSYDDEDAILDCIAPLVSTPSNFGFVPMSEGKVQEDKDTNDSISLIHLQIKSDHEFIVGFKTSFLNSSNRVRNAMYKHSYRIWSDWSNGINRF